MQSVNQILERNARVEADKAWETSRTRRAVIATITYCIAAFFMWRIGVSEPFLNAVVPTGGYLLSTLSLGMIKRWWLQWYESNNKTKGV